MSRARHAPARSGRRFGRALSWLVAICVGLELLYIVAANGFLSLGGVALMFESTNMVNATFRRAWSLWPGSVHVRDLRIVFQDANVQWSLDLSRVHTEIELLELVARRFHATHVEGDGVVFRMRHRIHPEDVRAPAAGMLPKIPEFSGPPVFEPTAPLPPIPEEEYNLWTVHLEGVDVNVREIWAHVARYVGNGRARGAFRLRPARTLWVGPASLDLEPGRLTLGERAELVRTLRGRLETTVHFFDVRKPVGMQVFRYVSAKASFRGAGFRVEPFQAFVPADAAVALSGTPGELRIDAALERGVVSEKSTLLAELPELRVQASGLRMTARGAELLARGAPGGRGEARFVAKTGTVERPGAPGPPLRLVEAVGAVTSSSRDTVEPWTVDETRVAVARAWLDDARGLHDLFALGDLALQGGALGVSGRGQLKNGSIRGEARAELSALSVRKDAASAVLDGALDMQVDALRPRERTGKLAATFLGKRLELRTKGTRTTADTLELVANASKTAAHAEAELRAELRGIGSSIGARVTAPRITLEARLVDDEQGTRRVVASARVPRLLARRENLALSAAFELGARFLQGPSVGAAPELATELALTDVELRSEGAASSHVLARAERFDLRSDLRRDGLGRLDGRITSEAKALWARLGGTWMRADPRLAAELTRFDPERGAGRVRAELAVKDFVADDRGEGLECPWSTIPSAVITADLELDPERGTRGTLGADLDGARVAWGDFNASGAALFRARLDQVFLGQGRGRMQYRFATSDIALKSGASETTGWAARIPTLILAGELVRNTAVSGSVRVNAERVEGRVGRTHIGTDVSADFRVLELDPEQSRARIAGKFRMDRARVRSGDEAVDDWWASVDIDSAAISASDNLDLSALFQARLRDALPGIAVLSASGDLPGWFGSALPLRELDVTGLVHRRCRLTDIQFTRVEGGPLSSRGRLQSVPESVRGAFIVRLADFEAISTGLSFDADATDVQLLASDGWLRERALDLDALAARALKGACAPSPRSCAP